VSWNDVQDYIAELNARTGVRYRLPTEAEWEYACRSGGGAERYCGGDELDRLAWHSGNSDGEPHPVGHKAANGLGLFDMSGNVYEWTCSTYDVDYGGAERACAGKGDSGRRVLRGGSWHDYPENLRSATRIWYGADNRNFNIGFRLAQDL
jgi:formylglycine-generating enzyme required for sulfatase activity